MERSPRNESGGNTPQFSDASDEEYLAAMAERAERYARKARPHFKFMQLMKEIIDDCNASKSGTSDDGKTLLVEYKKYT